MAEPDVDKTDKITSITSWICKRHDCYTVNTGPDFVCAKCGHGASPRHTATKSPASDGTSQSEGATEGTGQERLPSAAADHRLTSLTSPDDPASFERSTQHPSTAQDDTVLDFPDKECRIIMVGKTGTGKSSSGNTILGFDGFTVGETLESCTERCEWHKSQRFGVRLTVVDTPGLFDTRTENSFVTTEVARCIEMVSPGAHALLVFVRADVKFTGEEAEALEQIRILFGEDILHYTVIVFTHGDRLKPGSVLSFQLTSEVIERFPDSLKSVLQNVGGRHVVFNNEGSDETKSAQVRQLLEIITEVVSRRFGTHFTSILLTSVEDTIAKHVFSLMRRLGKDTVLFDDVRYLMREALTQSDVDAASESDWKKREAMKERMKLLNDLQTMFTKEWTHKLKKQKSKTKSPFCRVL